MKKFLFIYGLAVSVLFVSCKQQEKTAADKPAPKPTMSENTQLSAAPVIDENGYARITVPTVVSNSCDERITKAVKAAPGVLDIKVDIRNKIAKVKFDSQKISLNKIRHIISEAGYDADDVKRDGKAFEKLPPCCKIK